MSVSQNPEAVGAIYNMSSESLHPHPLNPFGVRDDFAMQELRESILQHGVLVPVIVRAREEGDYEIISGHRRKYACDFLGITDIPAIILDLDDDEAIIQLVDSNIQREGVLPSEKAWAYKLRMDAMKRQGSRRDLNPTNDRLSYRSDDEIGKKGGISGDTIRNYASLTNLIPELLSLVDEKKIALSPAYQLAYLSAEEQEGVLEAIESEQATPSLSQAKRMKQLSQTNALNDDTILSILMEQKRTIKKDVTLSEEKLRKYFPKSYSPGQIETVIFKLLEAWQRKKQRESSR